MTENARNPHKTSLQTSPVPEISEVIARALLRAQLESSHATHTVPTLNEPRSLKPLKSKDIQK